MSSSHSDEINNTDNGFFFFFTVLVILICVIVFKYRGLSEEIERLEILGTLKQQIAEAADERLKQLLATLTDELKEKEIMWKGREAERAAAAKGSDMLTGKMIAQLRREIEDERSRRVTAEELLEHERSRRLKVEELLEAHRRRTSEEERLKLLQKEAAEKEQMRKQKEDQTTAAVKKNLTTVLKQFVDKMGTPVSNLPLSADQKILFRTSVVAFRKELAKNLPILDDAQKEFVFATDCKKFHQFPGNFNFPEKDEPLLHGNTKLILRVEDLVNSSLDVRVDCWLQKDSVISDATVSMSSDLFAFLVFDGKYSLSAKLSESLALISSADTEQERVVADQSTRLLTKRMVDVRDQLTRLFQKVEKKFGRRHAKWQAFQREARNFRHMIGSDEFHECSVRNGCGATCDEYIKFGQVEIHESLEEYSQLAEFADFDLGENSWFHLNRQDLLTNRIDDFPVRAYLTDDDSKYTSAIVMVSSSVLGCLELDREGSEFEF